MTKKKTKFGGLPSLLSTIGVDETAVGSIAGPMVVSGVLGYGDARRHYPGNRYRRPRDSKELGKPEIRRIYADIERYSTGRKSLMRVTNRIISVEELDEYGFANAEAAAVVSIVGELAERWCVGNLPGLVVIDGTGTFMAHGIPKTLRDGYWAAFQRCVDNGLVRYIPRAEKSYWQVAAASVVANKIHADKMIALGESYPEYGFSSNYGYWCKEHIAALDVHGAIKGVHRKRVSHCKPYFARLCGVPSCSRVNDSVCDDDERYVSIVRDWSE